MPNPEGGSPESFQQKEGAPLKEKDQQKIDGILEALSKGYGTDRRYGQGNFLSEKTFSMPVDAELESKIKQASKTGILKLLSPDGGGWHYNELRDFVNKNPYVDSNLLHDPEIKEAGLKRIADFVGSTIFDNAIPEIATSLALEEQEVQKQEINILHEQLSKDETIQQAIYYIERHPIPPEIIQSPKFQEAIYQGLSSAFAGKTGVPYNIEQAIKLFQLDREEVKQIALRAVETLLISQSNHGYEYLHRALDITNKLAISPNDIEKIVTSRLLNNSPAQTTDNEQILDNIGSTILMDEFRSAGGIFWEVIKDMKSCPDDDVRKEASEAMCKKAIRGFLNSYAEVEDTYEKYPLEVVFPQFIEEFDISQDQLIKAVVEHMRSISSYSDANVDKISNEVGRILHDVNLSIDEKKDVLLQVGSVALLDRIQLQSSEELFRSAAVNMQDLISFLNANASKLIKQAQQSKEVLVSLYQYKDKPEDIAELIKEYPFLVEAIEANPRYGTKLFTKFPEFDQIAKDKIEALYVAKKSVMQSYPRINERSPEFRTSMQSYLLTLDRNQEIVEAITEHGLDTDMWLNYDEVERFRLEDEDIVFGEVVDAPLKRFVETIQFYEKTVKDALRPHRDELKSKTIEVQGEKKTNTIAQAAELSKKIAQEVEQNGASQKVEQMRKALARLEQPSGSKQIPLQEKIFGDLAAITRLLDPIVQGHNQIIQLEKQVRSGTNERREAIPSKQVLTLKGDLARKKEEIKKMYTQVNARFQSFQGLLSTTLPDALPESASQKIMDSIHEKSNMEFDHLDADRTALDGIFEKGGDKKKEDLVYRDMSITISSRNPDTDLYLGNYAPCCVRIESGYHGDESPIADYTTDLGMQIATITDDATGDPVAAAWLWLGVNEKNESALVIDNIEANTDYSSTFPQQLTEKLFRYLIDYAKSIGAPELVLGTDNNDLPTRSHLESLQDALNIYKKLGGTNGRGEFSKEDNESGYYLEAEDEQTKLVWRRK